MRTRGVEGGKHESGRPPADGPRCLHASRRATLPLSPGAGHRMVVAVEWLHSEVLEARARELGRSSAEVTGSRLHIQPRTWPLRALHCHVHPRPRQFQAMWKMCCMSEQAMQMHIVLLSNRRRRDLERRCQERAERRTGWRCHREQPKRKHPRGVLGGSHWFGRCVVS